MLCGSTNTFQTLQRNLTDDFRLAGSDTTGAALAAIFYYLLKNPATYHKLVQEIDEAAAAGLSSSPVVKYSEAVKLAYLDAVCKEGMRIHPSAANKLPRHVPPEGCMISGEWFAGGTRIGMNGAVVHRDKSVFGEDADVFNPERWFRKDASEMDKHLFHFSMGSRACIGKNVSSYDVSYRFPRCTTNSFFAVGIVSDL